MKYFTKRNQKNGISLENLTNKYNIQQLHLGTSVLALSCYRGDDVKYRLPSKTFISKNATVNASFFLEF